MQQGETTLILMGVDDTDVIGSPGTNQLCRQLATSLADIVETKRIIRHQLLVDSRVPYTSRNGSASLWLEPKSPLTVSELADRVIPEILEFAPEGSDPGLCLAETVPDAVRQFGLDCQQAVQTQETALQIAEEAGLYLKGLGGTSGGIIGALAAVGLAAEANDGRLIYIDEQQNGCLDSGWHEVSKLHKAGVDEIRCVLTGEIIAKGQVDIGKKLRPNLSKQRIVLFVEPVEDVAELSSAMPDDHAGPHWRALKIP